MSVWHSNGNCIKFQKFLEKLILNCGRNFECKKNLKILKSENLYNNEHLVIEYNCSWRLVISIAIKLGKPLNQGRGSRLGLIQQKPWTG